MILTVLLAAAQVAAPTVEDEIVVLAKRLATTSAIVGRDHRGRSTCSVTASTGSVRLDSALCRTAATCVKAGAVDQAAVSACIDRRKPALLADIRRAGSRR